MTDPEPGVGGRDGPLATGPTELVTPSGGGGQAQRVFADNEPWTMPELPGEVSVMEIGYHVSLSIYVEPPRVWTVQVNGPLALQPASGAPVDIDTEGPPGRLAPLLELLRSTLISATSDRFGTLELTFGHGDRIVVTADPRYESWQINGPVEGASARLFMVCTPGGELAIWGPEPLG